MADIRGMNNMEVRASNRQNTVMALHQYGAMTKQEIAERMGLSLPTVSVIVKQLSQQGLVTTGGTQESSGGRKPQLVMLAPDARYSAGIGITRRHIRLVLLNLGVSILGQRKIRISFEDTPAYWDALHRETDAFFEEYLPELQRLIGLGISLPGIIRPDNTMVFAPTLGSCSLDLVKLADSFEQDVEIGNDAKLAGFSQIFLDHNANTCIYLMLNKGVGGAIIVNGQLVTLGGHAGEFGHVTVVDGGRQCSCGKLGCLEAYCSSGVLREASGMELDEFFESVRAGHAENNRLLQEYLSYLALGINNLRVIFDSDVIVGGEVSDCLREYETTLKELLERRNPFGEKSDYLRIGDYGEYASTVGAALLPIHRFLS